MNNAVKMSRESLEPTSDLLLQMYFTVLVEYLELAFSIDFPRYISKIIFHKVPGDHSLAGEETFNRKRSYDI